MILSSSSFWCEGWSGGRGRIAKSKGSRDSSIQRLEIQETRNREKQRERHGREKLVYMLTFRGCKAGGKRGEGGAATRR
jgi:hypothetical protein